MKKNLFVCLAVIGVFIPLSLARAQDASELLVRVNRLEGMMRQQSGQLEQLQFENRQLKDQLRKFQEDVDFRFQDIKGTKPSSSGVTSPAGQSQKPVRRSDAFDPDQTPQAAGAPKALGATQASPPLQASSSNGIAGLIEEEGVAPLDLNATARTPQTIARPFVTGQPSIAANQNSDSRSDYEAAYGYLLQKQYEQAEMNFRGFLQSHPRSRMVPDATYWLGESFYQRGRHREAAEQFLKVTTDYANAGKAADAMLRLGQSLNQLGARDQACATYAELGRKYPQASQDVKQSTDREIKRSKC